MNQDDAQIAFAKRKLVHADEECPTYLWPKDVPIILDQPLMGEIPMVEIHVHPTGDENDRPSLIFVLQTPMGVNVAAPISLDKLWPAVEAAIKAKGLES